MPNNCGFLCVNKSKKFAECPRNILLSKVAPAVQSVSSKGSLIQSPGSTDTGTRAHRYMYRAHRYMYRYQGPQIHVQVPGPTDTGTGVYRYRYQGPQIQVLGSTDTCTCTLIPGPTDTRTRDHIYRYWGPRIQGLGPTDTMRVEHNYSVFWTEIYSIVDTSPTDSVYFGTSAHWYQCPVPSSRCLYCRYKGLAIQGKFSITWILGSTDTGTLTSVFRYYDTQIRQTGMTPGGYADTVAGLTSHIFDLSYGYLKKQIQSIISF